jgi:hypothetical protein
MPTRFKSPKEGAFSFDLSLSRIDLVSSRNDGSHQEL